MMQMDIPVKLFGFVALVVYGSFCFAQGYGSDSNAESDAAAFRKSVLRAGSKPVKQVVRDAVSRRELCRQIAERFQRVGDKRTIVYEGSEQPLELVEVDDATTPATRGLNNGTISRFVAVKYTRSVNFAGKTDAEVAALMENVIDVKVINGSGQIAAHVVESSLANDKSWPLNSKIDLSGISDGLGNVRFGQIEKLLVDRNGMMSGSFGRMSSKLTTSTVSFPVVGDLYVRDVVAAMVTAVNKARRTNSKFQIVPVRDPLNDDKLTWTVVVF